MKGLGLLHSQVLNSSGGKRHKFYISIFPAIDTYTPTDIVDATKILDTLYLLWKKLMVLRLPPFCSTHTFLNRNQSYVGL
jgi:hypothetical protein